MNFSKLANKINVGDRVWICDYRLNSKDVLNTPIRNVEPQEVVAVSNDELSPLRRIWGADIHFRPIKKNGELGKRIIPPFDNSGFPKGVNVFYNKKECVEFYQMQIIEAICTLKESQKLIGSKFENFISSLEGKCKTIK